MKVPVELQNRLDLFSGQMEYKAHKPGFRFIRCCFRLLSFTLFVYICVVTFLQLDLLLVLYVCIICVDISYMSYNVDFLGPDC